MDCTEAFRAVVAAPEPVDVPTAAVLIAAHAREHRGLDVEAAVQAVRDLAAGCAPDITAVCHRAFHEVGLRGNSEDYHDPRNSYLPDVLDRCVGIPISLAVILVEMGRAVGVELHGVGMPGHFLVGTDGGDVWIDAFDGGRRVDIRGAEAIWRRVHGARGRFDPAWLAPASGRAIVARMLANLERSLERRAPSEAVWAYRLHLAIPGTDVSTRAQLALSLGRLGAYPEAAAVLEDMIAALPPALADEATRRAAEFRARMN